MKIFAVVVTVLFVSTGDIFEHLLATLLYMWAVIFVCFLTSLFLINVCFNDRITSLCCFGLVCQAVQKCCPQPENDDAGKCGCCPDACCCICEQIVVPGMTAMPGTTLPTTTDQSKSSLALQVCPSWTNCLLFRLVAVGSKQDSRAPNRGVVTADIRRVYYTYLVSK